MGHGIDALFRLNVTFYLAGQNCYNSFWLRSKPTTTSATLQEECDSIIQDWMTYHWPNYQPFMSNEVQLVGMVCTCLNPLNMAQSITSYTAQFGTVASAALPPHDAGLVSLYTAIPGRRTHGRLYIPGVPAVLVASGSLTNAHLTKLSAIGTSLLQRWGATGTSPKVWGGVYSKKNGVTRQVGPPPYLTYRSDTHLPWTRAVIRATVRTMRKRMLNVGI